MNRIAGVVRAPGLAGVICRCSPRRAPPERARNRFDPSAHAVSDRTRGCRWAFLSSGDARDDPALSQIGIDAAGPVEDRVGLFHLEFEVPAERSLAVVVRRPVDRGVGLRPVDHRISWGADFEDPDGNGLEIGCDTRREAGGVDFWEGTNRPLALEAVLELLESS